MKPGMSTPPPESPEEPHETGGRRGSAMPGSQPSRAPGKGPGAIIPGFPAGPVQGSGPDGKLSGGEQLGEDAKDVAKAAVKGAVTGGAAGAGKAALVAAGKSKTTRKALIGAVAGVAAIALMLMSSLGGAGAAGNSVAINSAEHSQQGYQVAATQFDDVEALDTIRVAADRADARWEVVAAIYMNIEARSDHKGAGPMGIDLDKVDDDHPISKEDVESLEKSAYYVGGLLTPGLEKAAPGLNSYELDSGYDDAANGPDDSGGSEDEEESKEGESESEEFRTGLPLTADDKKDAKDDDKKDDKDDTDKVDTIVRTAIDTEEATALRLEIKNAYVAAIESLPLEPNPDMAEDVFDVALAWSVGTLANPQGECGPVADGGTGDITLGGQTTVDLNDSQLKYAQAIINRTASRGLPKHAAVIALATAMQESTLRMWWNVRVPGSEALTQDKDARGSDGYSVGLFQQQVNGNAFSWGTVNDAMNPAKSTDMFLDRLLTIASWESLPVSQAAQRVQVSAYPDAYAKWEGQARQLVNDLKPTQGSWKDSHDSSSSKAKTASLLTDREPLKITTAMFAATEKKADDGKDLKLPSHLKVNPAITPDAQAAEMAVGTRFGSSLITMGDYRNSSDDHGQMRAIDFMVKDYASASGIKSGTEIANFLIANDKALGVEYLIWRDRIWLGQSTGWKPYSTGGYGSMYAGNWNDTNLHNDHVHLTVYGNKGTGGEFKYVSPDPGADVSPCSGDHGTSPATGVGSGNGDDYPFKAPVGVCAWCSGGDNTDPWGLFKRECVSFVAWRMNQQMGWKEGQPYPFSMGAMGMAGAGNASQWKSGLAGRGYITDSNPKVGSVAWWDANVNFGVISTLAAGHVAVVTEVHSDGNIVVEQYNGPGSQWKYSTMTLHKSKVSGFIHVADIKDPKPSKPEKPTTD